MELQYAKNPVWANRSKTLINLTVRFKEIPEDLPFTANPDDSAEHGKELYKKAMAGEFGAIAEFNAPSPTVESVSNAIVEERNKRLLASDWTQLPDVPEATKLAWESYRQALRDMPQNANFPWYSLVVVETDFGFATNVNNAPFPVAP